MKRTTAASLMLDFEPHWPAIAKSLEWDTGFTIQNGRYGFRLWGVCVDLDGWHLRSHRGQVHGLGSNLREARAELTALAFGTTNG